MSEIWSAIIAVGSVLLTAYALRKNDIIKEKRNHKKQQEETIRILLNEIEFSVDAIKNAMPTLESRKTGTSPADLTVCKLCLLKLADFNEPVFLTFINRYKFLPREVSESVFRFFRTYKDFSNLCKNIIYEMSKVNLPPQKYAISLLYTLWLNGLMALISIAQCQNSDN